MEAASEWEFLGLEIVLKLTRGTELDVNSAVQEGFAESLGWGFGGLAGVRLLTPLPLSHLLQAGAGAPFVIGEKVEVEGHHRRSLRLPDRSWKR